MAPSSSQDVAVLLPVTISLVTTLTTILVHAIAFAAIARFVRREYRLGRAGAQFWRDVAIIAGVTLLAFVAHLVEIAIWAVVLEVLRGIHAPCHSLLSLGSELQLSGLWRYSHVQFLEIVGAVRSSRRDAYVRRLNGNDLCRHAAIGPDADCKWFTNRHTTP